VIETTEDIGGRIINNYIKFQSVQDRTSLVDRFNTGDTIKVHFNIKGSKWEKNGQVNYITNLDAWRIENVNMQTQDNSQPAGNNSYSTTANASADIPDDLPF
jgi:ribosomal protein L19